VFDKKKGKMKKMVVLLYKETNEKTHTQTFDEYMFT